MDVTQYRIVYEKKFSMNNSLAQITVVGSPVWISVGTSVFYNRQRIHSFSSNKAEKEYMDLYFMLFRLW